METVACPYCEYENDIDVGDYRSEDSLQEEQCESCGKRFGVQLSISHSYYPEKVDCWNDGNHIWKNRVSAPREYSIGKQACHLCGEEREIDGGKWEKIDADHSHPENWRSK